MSSIQLERVLLSGVSPLTEGAQSLPNRVKAGELIIARKALQALGEFEAFRDLALRAVAEAAGQNAERRLAIEGFEKIHEILKPSQLFAANQLMAHRYQKIGPRILKKLCRRLLDTEAFYFEHFANVRFDIPFDVWVNDREKYREFGLRYGDGKLTVHGPHHDTWHKLPDNSINLWMAISSVQPGNGLSVYPQVFGKILPHLSNLKIAPEQYYGPAVNFSMEAGDILLFHGEHLHSTELNRVDSTRFVVSYRVALEKPNFVAGRSRFIQSRVVGTLRFQVNEWAFKTAMRVKRKLPRKWLEKLGTRKVGHAVTRPFDDLSQEFPKEISGDADLAGMPIGSIRPLSQKLCVARLGGQKWVKFARKCPHEGADLAGGYLRDGNLFCPWHNLSFDLETGYTPCRAIRALPIEPIADSRM